MRVFKWNSGHAVYLAEIDAEHRAIFHAAGELQKTIEGNAPTERILEGLRALIAAAEDHFAHEERLMADSHYLSLSWHKHQHDTARNRLKQFAADLEVEERDAAYLMLEFLSGWMRDHLGVADRMMGAHLRNYRRANAA